MRKYILTCFLKGSEYNLNPFDPPSLAAKTDICLFLLRLRYKEKLTSFYYGRQYCNCGTHKEGNDGFQHKV